MTHITVIGSCPCRDLFENDVNRFSFNTDIRFVSPASFIANDISGLKVEFSDLSNKASIFNGNWYKKNILNDLNKSFIDNLKENHGEYLVMDLAESRLPLCEIEFKAKNEKTLVTYSACFRAHYKNNLQKNHLKSAKLNIINPLSYDKDTWESIITEYAKNLLTIFEEEKIILIETTPATHFVDSSGCLRPYLTEFHQDNINVCQELLPSLYDIFKKICPKCKVIKMPPFLMGDAMHKWKNHPFHYTQTVYNYLYECVSSIVDNDYHNMNLIYEKYSKVLKSEYEQHRLNSINDFFVEKPKNINYLDIINNDETLNSLSRRKKARLLFVLNKKEFNSYLKNNLFKKR